MKPYNNRDSKPSARRGVKSYGASKPWERGSDDREGGRSVFQAICDQCNKACDVPFKPTGSKPVLCNACYNKDKFTDQKRARGRMERPAFGDRPRSDYDSRGASKGNDQVSAQLRMINDKLDIILRAIQ